MARKGGLGRVDLLLLAHLLSVGILDLLIVSLALLVLLQRPLTLEGVAHML